MRYTKKNYGCDIHFKVTLVCFHLIVLTIKNGFKKLISFYQWFKMIGGI
jgi:hypothetical protein